MISSGTSVLARNRKMITCAHVLANEKDSKLPDNERYEDMYFAIHKDEMGIYHCGPLNLKLGETLHVYPGLDLAVITLPSEFYSSEGKYFLHPDHHVKISVKPRGLGYSTAILGYPFQSIRILNNSDMDYSNICLRADKGVVNYRAQKAKEKYVYEFTMPFNPGNSGGPVFDTKTGEVFALVQGYRSHTLQNSIQARYSIAFSMNMFKEPLQEHGIID